MKSFIKDKLRLVLEGRLSTHSAANNHKGPIGTKSLGFIGNEEDFRHEMSIMANIYRNNQEAFLPREGEGLYEFQMIDLGKGKYKITGKHNSVGSKKQGGMDADGRNSRYFYVNANNAEQVEDLIQYKKVKRPDETGKKEYYISPSDMAFVKLLTEMADRVLAFMDESGYDDGKGEEIGAEKMTSWNARKKEKKALEAELGRAFGHKEWEDYKATGKMPAKVDHGEISLDSDAKDLYAQIQDVVVAKRKAIQARDKDRVKQLKKLEQELRAKM